MFRFLVIAIVLATISSGVSFRRHRPFNSGWSKIVGGQDAEEAIPYMVSITYYGSHHCGGAIINKRAILTAAHCVHQMNKRLMKVRIGTVYQYINKGILIEVENWKMHEGFDSATMDNDIAVIFLAKDIPFEDGTIEPIAMADKKTELPDGTITTVTGWGLLEMNGPDPAILQVANVPIINYETCLNLMEGKITPRMLCAGYMEGGIDACQMDSGGPLVADKKLVGIVSWGDGCAKPGRPGIYAKVSELRDWIDVQINEITSVNYEN